MTISVLDRNRAADKTEVEPQAPLGALHDAEQDLYDSGRHLNTWWQTHAKDTSLWLAIDEELAARYEHERDQDHPPDTVLERENEYDIDMDADIEPQAAPGLGH